MQSTRQHILDYLRVQRSASAQELGLVFGMTRANLRHHLKRMQAESVVEIITERPSQRRGRPEQLYALSDKAQPANMDALAHVLLDELASPLPAKRGSTRLKHLAKRLLGNAPNPVGQISQRLVNAVRRLDALGYRARWEARPGGPEIVLGQCPYSSIIAQHPELCQMDTQLLKNLVGEDLKQISKLEPGPEGLPQCVFALQKQA